MADEAVGPPLGGMESSSRFVDVVGVSRGESLSSTRCVLQALRLGGGSHLWVNRERPGTVAGPPFILTLRISGGG